MSEYDSVCESERVCMMVSMRLHMRERIGACQSMCKSVFIIMYGSVHENECVE